MAAKIQLISTDFDGTLVCHASDPVFDPRCMEQIASCKRRARLGDQHRPLRRTCWRKAWRISLSAPARTSSSRANATSFARPSVAGSRTAIGTSAARRLTPSFTTALRPFSPRWSISSAERRRRASFTKPRTGRPDRDERGRDGSADRSSTARGRRSRNSITSATPSTCAFCHADYHKGAALAELSRLTNIRRRRHLRGRRSSQRSLDARRPLRRAPACPANAIAEVKEAVRRAAAGWRRKGTGAGVHEALRHFPWPNTRLTSGGKRAAPSPSRHRRRYTAARPGGSILDQKMSSPVWDDVVGAKNFIPSLRTESLEQFKSSEKFTTRRAPRRSIPSLSMTFL